MRKKAVSATILAIALSAVLCSAQDPSTGSEKLAVINIQQAIAQTGEGKQALDVLGKKYEPKRQALQRQQDEINALQDQIQKQGATLSDEERSRLTRDLDQKQRLFKRDQDDDQADWQADNQDAVQRIGQKMVKIISDYAQKNSYALVLDDSQLPVYYVAKGVDITDPIVKLYDQANPASAPAASAPASSTAKPAAAKPKS
jgi:outer membrane protein